jgi:hypothetical protein
MQAYRSKLQCCLSASALGWGTLGWDKGAVSYPACLHVAYRVFDLLQKHVSIGVPDIC